MEATGEAMSELVKSFYSFGEQEGKWIVALFDFYADGKGIQFIIDEFDNETEAQLRANELETERVSNGSH